MAYTDWISVDYARIRFTIESRACCWLWRCFWGDPRRQRPTIRKGRCYFAGASGPLQDPTFAGAVNVRYFPDLSVKVGEIWKGDATSEIFDTPGSELSALRPTSVGVGYRFSFAFTVDDLFVLKDLRLKDG